MYRGGYLYMMKKVIILLYFIFIGVIGVSGQMVIDKAGDYWDYDVIKAIELIEKTDEDSYKNLFEYCDKITFWNQKYSTNFGTCTNKGIITLSSYDMKSHDVNDVAAALVHESYHLRLRYMCITLPVETEESLCYQYEYNFLKKIPDINPLLLYHCKRYMIK